MMPVRLFLDQNTRAETLDFLRGLGLDVTSTREQGMSTATDDEIARWAAADQRIIITFNHHFGDTRSPMLPGHPGVIRLRIEPQTTEVVHPVLENLFRCTPHDKLWGALTTVTRDKIRIWRLV